MSIKAEGVLGCDVTSMSKCGTVVSGFYPQEDSFLIVKKEEDITSDDVRFNPRP